MTTLFSLPHKEDFVGQMKNRWVRTLTNVSNSNLEAVWGDLADSLHAMALLNSGQVERPQEPRVIAIPAPTGSGKSQGLLTYLACCYQQSVKCSHKQFPYTLVVVREQATAERFVSDLNEMTEEGLANYHHSKHKLDTPDAIATKVLVMCHASYEKAMLNEWQQTLVGETPTAFDLFITTDKAPNTFGEVSLRELIVVDEEMNLQASSQVATHQNEKVAGLNLLQTLPHSIQSKFEDEMFAISLIRSYLEEQKETQEGVSLRDILLRSALGALWGLAENVEEEASKAFGFPTLDWRGMMVAVNKVDFSKEFSMADGGVRKLAVLDVLNNLHTLQLSQNGFTTKAGKEITLATSVSIIPHRIKQVLVLDATAEINALYQNTGEVAVVKNWEHPRNYQNLTIKVAWQHTGRTSLVNAPVKARDSAKTIQNFLMSENDVPTLVVSHKGLTPYLEKKSISADLAYWGSLDGKNDWQNCHRVVLFGLNHKDRAFYEKRAFGSNSDITLDLHEFVVSDLAVEITQALARVRVRKTVDTEGNCQPTTAFLTLPDDSTGKAILRRVEEQFPNCVVDDWALDAHRPTKQSNKVADKGGRPMSAENKKLLRHIKGKKGTAPVKVSDICHRLGIVGRTTNKITEHLANPMSQLSLAIEQTGHLVDTTGDKRKTYYIK